MNVMKRVLRAIRGITWHDILMVMGIALVVVTLKGVKLLDSYLYSLLM